MLCRVIGEDPLDARHQPDQQQVCEEDQQTQDALAQVAEDRTVDEAIDGIVSDDQRQHEEEPDAQPE